MTLVTMINSVDEYVAGEQYDLDPETADRFVLKGYALGDVSRDYTPEEIEALNALDQGVGF